MKPDNNPPLPIKDSKGNIYVVCPFLEAISAICDPHLPSLEMYELQRHLEAIRNIARHWQAILKIECAGYILEGDPTIAEEIAKPYNYTKTLKILRMHLESGTLTTEKFDEIIELYQ